jgi:hypothetical protein
LYICAVVTCNVQVAHFDWSTAKLATKHVVAREASSTSITGHFSHKEEIRSHQGSPVRSSPKVKLPRTITGGVRT